MPGEIKSLKLSSLVLSRTQRLGHYQSGDAAIEEVNKEAKRDLVGVPSENQWKRSFRNLDSMNKIRSATFSDAGINDPKSSSNGKNMDIQKEVLKVRILIRKSKYLENPMTKCIHTDITGSVNLSSELVNFTENANENLNDYLPKILRNEPYKKRVIYTTLEERIESEKIENCTVPEIQQKICILVESFPNKELYCYIFKKEVAGKSKGVHIDFYNTLLEMEADTMNEDDRERTKFSAKPML